MMMIMLLNTALIPALSERSANTTLNHLQPFLYAYNPDSCSTADVALCNAATPILQVGDTLNLKPLLPRYQLIPCRHFTFIHLLHRRRHYSIPYSHISLLTLDIHHFR
ncbi:hypothetical protein BKA56DRAFT_602130 [Ilyonectria sp. MPI-CAGE-AT-0026]|nr:hypothetical protein BKA56DRAFT_602130 [Ilyonectria sp. MPI-CAGE-AT-0026]